MKVNDEEREEEHIDKKPKHVSRLFCRLLSNRAHMPGVSGHGGKPFSVACTARLGGEVQDSNPAIKAAQAAVDAAPCPHYCERTTTLQSKLDDAVALGGGGELLTQTEQMLDEARRRTAAQIEGALAAYGKRAICPQPTI